MRFIRTNLVVKPNYKISAQNLLEDVYQQEDDSNEEVKRFEQEYFSTILPNQLEKAIQVAKREEGANDIIIRSYAENDGNKDPFVLFEYPIEIPTDMDESLERERSQEIMQNVVEAFYKELNKNGHNLNDENFDYEWRDY